MCGIVGICNFINKPNTKTVKLMNKALHHRGPDDEGYFNNETVSFGHKRLSIIDIKNSIQPMIDKTNGNILVYNGEIYNFEKIKFELKNLGYDFETSGDTEVILKAYDYWGTDCLIKFEGMFAFAIWDNKKKHLFVARDKFGEKPFFYTYLDDYGFIFSSEIKSFINVDEIKKNLKIDYTSLNTYLSLNYLIADKTFFKEVYSLEPSSYLIINQDNFKKFKSKRYWFLESYFKTKTKDKYNFSTKKLDNLIKDSTKLRMISDVPNGTFLSGGIDSSIISLQLKNIDNHRMSAHNLSFNEKNFDEYADAKVVTHHLGIKLNKYNVPESNKLVEDFPKIINAMDQPMSDTSFIATYYLSKYSSKISKMVLSGDGADELFGGYPTYQADLVKRFLPRKIFKYISYFKFFLKFFKNSSGEKIGFKYRLNKFLSSLEHKDLYAHVLWREIFTLKEKKNIINEKLVGNMNYEFLDYFKKENNYVLDLNYLDRFMYIDLKSWLPNNVLYKIDRSTMSNSQEARVPFLDSNIAEYACSMPTNFKFNLFNKKKILKETVRRKLPKSFFKKKKSGFNSPIGIWLIDDENFKKMALNLLYTKNMLKLFNKNIIENIWESHQNMEFDESFKIFNLICLSQWLENNNLESNL